MKSVKRRLFSPLKLYGGKSQLAKKLAKKMEYRPIFVNGFAGTCINSLVLDEVFDRHVCIDTNRWIINFFRVLQTDPSRLHKFLLNTEYSEENFIRAREYVRSHEDDPGEPFFDAALYFVCVRMSRSADLVTYGWSDRSRKGKPEYISAYQSAIDNLPDISSRINKIEFYCGKYMEVSRELGLDTVEEKVEYLDPPYLPETRVTAKAYGKHEMSPEDHAELLNFIKSSPGIKYLSGYHSDLYNSRLGGYNKWEWTVTKSSSQRKSGKPLAVEVLWEIK